MRRIVSLVFWVWFAVTVGYAATPSLHYASPYTELDYRYISQQEGLKAEFWTYRFRTELGRYQLTVISTDQRLTITSELEGAPSSEVLSLAAPSGPGVGEIELTWPDLRKQARYVKHEGADALERVAGWPLDCEALVNGELARTKRDLLARVEADYARHDEPPTHLEELVGALYAAKYLPLLAASCEVTEEPAGGACYYDYTGYEDCIDCCDVYGALTTSVCSLTLGRICTSGWCTKIGRQVCRGAVNFASDLCDLHNCRGKPGDPWCDQNQPCEGSCIYFCGPGWSSACGHCEDSGSNQQACCR